MIDWGSVHFERIWPLWLGFSVVLSLIALWFFHQKAHFPDMTLITNTIPWSGGLDRIPFVLGILIMLLLLLIMMEPTFVRLVTVEQRARDFLVIVDTSRSMRHDTNVPREGINLRFERRAGTFSTVVDDPRTLPYLARYELARESLLTFLDKRIAQDRVGMIYFNDDAFTMSAPTANIDFIVNQLAMMDEYVNWGTDIATAVESGLNLLGRYPAQNKKAVILLTDAESTYTKELEQQLTRLKESDVSFYLLWITTDESDMSNKEVAALLDSVRAVGTVITIENLDAYSLDNSLRDISRLEGYSYEETKRRRVDLSLHLLKITQYLLLIWLFLVATIFHPTTDRGIFKGGSI